MYQLYIETITLKTSAEIVEFKGPQGDGWNGPDISCNGTTVQGRWGRPKPAPAPKSSKTKDK